MQHRFWVISALLATADAFTKSRAVHRIPVIRRVNGEVKMASSPVSENVVTIEYCTRCKWMMRSAWMAQELLTTFDDGTIAEMRLRPQFSDPGGDFKVCSNRGFKYMLRSFHLLWKCIG
jgi:hypothetical protein